MMASYSFYPTQRYQYNSARLSGFRMMASYSFYPTLQTATSHFIFNFEEQSKSEGYAKNYRFTVLYSRTPKLL